MVGTKFEVKFNDAGVWFLLATFFAVFAVAIRQGSPVLQDIPPLWFIGSLLAFAVVCFCGYVNSTRYVKIDLEAATIKIGIHSFWGWGLRERMYGVHDVADVRWHEEYASIKLIGRLRAIQVNPDGLEGAPSPEKIARAVANAFNIKQDSVVFVSRVGA